MEETLKSKNDWSAARDEILAIICMWLLIEPFFALSSALTLDQSVNEGEKI